MLFYDYEPAGSKPSPLAAAETKSTIIEKQKEKDDKKQYSAFIIAYASNAAASSVNSHKSIPPYKSVQSII